MNIRKIFYILILTFFILLLFQCQKLKNEKTNNQNKINVVCSIFPEFDWTQNIIGENYKKFNLKFLIQNGLNMHNYMPTEADINSIKTADLIIYNGGKSEKWIEDAIQTSINPNQKTLKLIDIIKENKNFENNAEIDEHIWLSLKNAQLLSNAIKTSLIDLTPEFVDSYSNNCQKYTGELQLLHEQFLYTTTNASRKTFIFCDNFPFYYLFNDYNLNYISAFSDCSSQNVVNDETIQLLADKINENNIKYIYGIETTGDKLSNDILKKSHNYDCESIKIDSLQSTTLRSALEGKTYLQIMQKNLQELEKGLK